MSTDNLTGDNPKPVCTICFEDLKPIVEDLQSIPICGHVFHELCIQQWMEYCPSGKKPTCPVCKQSCARTGLTRLYFQSTCEQTQLGNSFEKVSSGKKIDVEELEKEVRRLEGKISALGVAVENREICIMKLNDELSAWKELANKEAVKREEYKKERDRMELHLKMKMEELSRTSTECTKLQERSLGLAKELAALKLATDLNLGEEDMVKLASLGHSNNPQNTIDVLKKSLALRNKSYKELMTQCNLLGRSDTRAHKKLDKSKEKIKKLNERLQELEKALEEKENEVLRNLKSSSHKDQSAKPVEETGKPNQINFPINHVDHSKKSVNHPEIHHASTSLASKEHDEVFDLETDSFLMEEDKVNEHLNHDSDLENSPMHAQRDASERILERKVTHVATTTWMTETSIIDDISKQTPSIAVKNEAHIYDSAAYSGGLFRPEGANRTIGKWCKSASLKTTPSNGDLISVGSDGRGGRVKVLRDHDQVLDEKAKTLWPKKHKHGAKQSGQFRIENFFGKMES